MRQKKEEKNYLHKQEIYMEVDEHPIRQSIRVVRERIINFYEKEEALPRSTFVLRVCVSLILFLIFAGIDYEKTSVGTYDSAKIIEGNYISATGGRILKVS